MRIDRPIGNESHLTGSFTGSFYGVFDGEHIGLSGSIQEIYDKIDEVSGNLDQHISEVSASITGTIGMLSESFDHDRTLLSRSFDETIRNLSGSVTGSITELSASINTTIQRVSSSIDTQITILSSSFDQDRTDLSASFDHDRTILSASFAEIIYDNSHSIDRTIRNLSRSFDQDRTELSRSFDGTITALDQDLQSQIDDTRATYTPLETFDNYKTFVDQTYYKSGSRATLNQLQVNDDVIVDGDAWIHGNLKVEGSASIVHTEEIIIGDKFIEIASGATSPSDAEGAGFGIRGANVTMSYHHTLDGGYMGLNKPLVATSFTGSLQGNVQGNLEGNVVGDLTGTASNAVSSSYAVTSSQALTASQAGSASYASTSSYAGEIGDDGTIALAIKRLENVARTKTEDKDRGMSPAIFYLNCGAHKDYQTCSVNRPEVTLDVPSRVVPGVEHYLLLTNVGNQDCIVTGSAKVMIPPSVISKYSWEYRYEYEYIEYSTPPVAITAVQTIPSKTIPVFNGHLDGGNSGATPKSRYIQLDQIDIAAEATVEVPLVGETISRSGQGRGTGEYEDKFKVPQGQRLCLSYFTVDDSTVVITSAQRLKN